MPSKCNFIDFEDVLSIPLFLFCAIPRFESHHQVMSSWLYYTEAGFLSVSQPLCEALTPRQSPSQKA